MLRKILKVKTIGSREEGNLRPIVSDNLPMGVNLVVLEYNETEKWAIVEIFGSDYGIIPKEKRITTEKINSVVKSDDVIDELASHSESPISIASIGIIRDKVDSYNKTTKKAVIKGKSYNVKRVEDTGDEEILIIDE